jgi:hypothetical protein
VQRSPDRDTARRIDRAAYPDVTVDPHLDANAVSAAYRDRDRDAHANGRSVADSRAIADRCAIADGVADTQACSDLCFRRGAF